MCFSWFVFVGENALILRFTAKKYIFYQSKRITTGLSNSNTASEISITMDAYNIAVKYDSDVITAAIIPNPNITSKAINRIAVMKKEKFI